MSALRFTILGPVRAWRDDTEIPLGTAQQRALAALLLAAAAGPGQGTATDRSGKQHRAEPTLQAHGGSRSGVSAVWTRRHEVPDGNV